MGMILMIAIMTIAIAVSYLKPIVAQPKPPESKDSCASKGLPT